MADPYSNMVPGAFDSLQILLVKATFYAQAAAEAQGATSADGMLVTMTPQNGDSLQTLAYKLAYWLMQISDAGGGGGSTNVLYDNVAALPAAPSDPAVVWVASFRDGADSQVWDPNAAAWI